MKANLHRCLEIPFVVVIFISLIGIEVQAESVSQQCLIETWIHTVAFSPDGQLALATWTSDKAKLWDIQTGKTLLSFSATPNSWMSGMAFSPSGRYVLTSDSRAATVWDSNTGDKLRDFRHDVGDYCCSSALFTPNEDYVLSSSYDGGLLFNFDTGEKAHEFPGISQRTGQIAAEMSADGQFVLTSDENWKWYLWDLRNGDKLHTFQHAFDAGFSSDSHYVVTDNGDKGLELWSIDTKTSEGVLNQPDSYGTRQWQFSKDSRYIAIQDSSGFVLKSVEHGEVLHNFGEIHDPFVNFLSDNQHLLIIDNPNQESDLMSRLQIWDINTYTLVREAIMELRISSVTAFDFSLNDKFLLTGSNYAGIQLWSVETGEKLKQLC